MATWPKKGVTTPASNTSGQRVGISGGRLQQTPVSNTTAQIAGGQVASPMFGRPTWTYVNVQAGPVRGPQPRLARGSGVTGGSSLPGNAPQLPGYLTDNEYFPSQFTYDPIDQPNFLYEVPRQVPSANNGRDMIGTYNPHVSTPGQRFNHQMRQAANWQIMEYPPDNRNLLAWKQAERYRIASYTLSARPPDSSNYFLGYQVDPRIQQAIGGNSIGYMGSQ